MYEPLNGGLEPKLAAYRKETAGKATGDVLEIGGGTGLNLPFYSPDVNLTVVEPNPHMARRIRKKAMKMGREVRIVSDMGESLSIQDSSFDSVVSTLVLCCVRDLHSVVLEAGRSVLLLRARCGFRTLETAVPELAHPAVETDRRRL